MAIVNSYLLPNCGTNGQGILVIQQDTGVVSGTNFADGTAIDTTTLNYWIGVINSQIQSNPSPIPIQIDLLGDFMVPETM